MASGNQEKSASTSATFGSKPHRRRRKEVPMQDFGICLNVKGVLSRGHKSIPAAKKGMGRLRIDDQMRFPVAFVTNALELDADMADKISQYIGFKVTEDQLVQAQTPLKGFKKYHDQHCLVVGQGKIREIAKELGFTNVCTIEEVAAAYPKLDIADHENRKKNEQEYMPSINHPRVEAIVMMGEPKRWETALQLILDLLRTHGKPDARHKDDFPVDHIPVIACNMDLRFMDEAEAPRFGHGSFLVCLEALYKKHTNRELVYKALVGKPSEITFRYAELVLHQQALKLGIDAPLRKMFFIGDVPEVDVVGANLYQRYIDDKGKDLPENRQMPDSAEISEQTIEKVYPILVTTGVYESHQDPDERAREEDYVNLYSHRDFIKESEDRFKPQIVKVNVDDAIDYILGFTDDAEANV